MNKSDLLTLKFLGTSNAIPDKDHLNAHLSLETSDRIVLIDSSGTPFVRLEEAQIDLTRITDLIITHFHPDHVSGVPMLLMGLWLLGRTDPLTIHGLDSTLMKLREMMSLFEWESWNGFYRIDYKKFHKFDIPLIEDDHMIIRGERVRHLIPTLGIRIESKRSGKSIAYTSDTEPCSGVIKLGENADFLIHETAGESRGHSSVQQAVTDAIESNSKNLKLIHYNRADENLVRDITSGNKRYDGEISLSLDLEEIQF